MSLIGKTVVVTGAAAGIGAETARRAIDAGGRVIGVDLDRPASTDGFASFHSLDIAAPEAVERFGEAMSGGIDALLNVAGVSSRFGVERTLAVNFYGLRHLTKCLLPRIRDGGAIVNVASIAGRHWQGRAPTGLALIDLQGMPSADEMYRHGSVTAENVYDISKEMVVLWTFRMSQALLDRGIRVNAVSPGPVETLILEDFRATLGEDVVAGNIAAVRRPGTPAEIAAAIVWLAGDGAAWVNGANLPVDGGLDAFHTLSTLQGGLA